MKQPKRKREFGGRVCASCLFANQYELKEIELLNAQTSYAQNVIDKKKKNHRTIMMAIDFRSGTIDTNDRSFEGNSKASEVNQNENAKHRKENSLFNISISIKNDG